jgi:hypothetical protein
MPLNLADAELQVVIDAARTLRPVDRPAFLQAVANALGAHPTDRIGLGLVGQVCRDCQAQILEPAGRCGLVSASLTTRGQDSSAAPGRAPRRPRRAVRRHGDLRCVIRMAA